MEDYRKIAIELGQTLISKAPETKEDVERMLPELKESEDEKVREEIIIYLKSVISNKKFGDEIIESWIDWLEKQGQKPTDKVEPKFHEGDIIIHKELGGDYIHNPHKIIQVDILDKKYRLEGGLVAHFGEQEDYELVEQKPAWSEEDDYNLQCCIAKVQYDIDNGRIGRNRELLTWLKSLKDRVQPKQEWSEEDNIILSRIIADYERSNEEWFNAQKSLPHGRKINWLKSLRSQNRWKPSDEQMEYLAKAITTLGDEGNCKTASILNYLRVELKKLRGE